MVRVRWERVRNTPTDACGMNVCVKERETRMDGER